MTAAAPEVVRLRTIAREWGRLGVIGFGGPPAHISLLRRLCVDERGWLPAHDFEDAIAATNLLPGPASTQLAIFCAWRLRGRPGALVGGLCFILPGLVMILALSVLFLGNDPPHWVLGAAGRSRGRRTGRRDERSDRVGAIELETSRHPPISAGPLDALPRRR